MTHARAYATATLLPNGKVLIAGGVDAIGIPVFQIIGSAELYDPVSGKFTRTGSMKAARYDATAVLLADGRVLIMGGNGCQDPARCTMRHWAGEIGLKSAELYDPTTDRFSPTGSMSEPRDRATATLLPDGRVLVLGGYDKVVEAYDPTTGKFTPAGTLINQYEDVVAAHLPNDKVLVVGDGMPGGLGAELFDPGTGLSTSVRTQVLPTSSFDPDGIRVLTDTLLEDGRVLVQVSDSDTLTNYLFTYDTATGTFTQAGSIDTPAGWTPMNAVLLRDGRVFFAGGGDNHITGGSNLGDWAGIYDPATGFHLLDSKMPEPRCDHAMTALSDDDVLIAGGEDGDILSSADLFRP